MNTTVSEVDFLIVGAGPIGSALALSLSEISASVSVVLVDHMESTNSPLDKDAYDSKVFAINSGSRQLFEDLGVWNTILKARVCAYQRMHVWDSEGTGSVTFDADEFEVDKLGFIVEAGLIQSALDQKIDQQQNIRVCRPAKIINRTRDKERIGNRTHIELDNGDVFVTRIVCAADGARSALRDKAGIAVNSEDCHQQALVANIQLERPHESCAWQIFRPTGPLAFLPLPPASLEQSAASAPAQDHCSIVWTLDNAEAKRINALDDAEFLIELERAVEGRFGKLEIKGSRISFPLFQRHAIDYGVEELILVGDAAHSIHPLAGLGANLGFQDVICLSKEFRRASERGIPFEHKTILGRYQRQRKLDNELTLKAMTFFRTSFSDRGLLVNAARNLGLKLFSQILPIKKAVARQALMPE